MTMTISLNWGAVWSCANDDLLEKFGLTPPHVAHVARELLAREFLAHELLAPDA